jgi:hypothetical protein
MVRYMVGGGAGDGVPGGRRGRAGAHGGVGGRPRGDHGAGRVRAAPPHLATPRLRDGAERRARALRLAGMSSINNSSLSLSLSFLTLLSNCTTLLVTT